MGSHADGILFVQKLAHFGLFGYKVKSLCKINKVLLVFLSKEIDAEASPNEGCQNTYQGEPRKNP